MFALWTKGKEVASLLIIKCHFRLIGLKLSTVKVNLNKLSNYTFIFLFLSGKLLKASKVFIFSTLKFSLLNQKVIL